MDSVSLLQSFEAYVRQVFNSVSDSLSERQTTPIVLQPSVFLEPLEKAIFPEGDSLYLKYLFPDREAGYTAEEAAELIHRQHMLLHPSSKDLLSPHSSASISDENRCPTPTIDSEGEHGPVSHAELTSGESYFSNFFIPVVIKTSSFQKSSLYIAC